MCDKRFVEEKVLTSLAINKLGCAKWGNLNNASQWTNVSPEARSIEDQMFQSKKSKSRA